MLPGQEAFTDASGHITMEDPFVYPFILKREEGAETSVFEFDGSISEE